MKVYKMSKMKTILKYFINADKILQQTLNNFLQLKVMIIGNSMSP